MIKPKKKLKYKFKTECNICTQLLDSADGRGIINDLFK